MITLSKSQFKMRILYKSGNSQEFWCTKFTYNDGTYNWKHSGDVNPIILGADSIEAVYQMKTKANIFEWFSVKLKELF